MNIINKKNFLFEDVSVIEGVGKKLSIYLKKKKNRESKWPALEPSLLIYR